MNALGYKWIPVEKFSGSRNARIKNFHQLLASNRFDFESNDAARESVPLFLSRNTF